MKLKRVKLNELKKEFPETSNEEFRELARQSYDWTSYNDNTNAQNNNDDNIVSVLYFNWKTWENNVYKIKETSTGANKAIKKDDTFDPPKDQRSRFEKVAEAIEVVYEGVLILGSNTLLKWEKATNMVRPNSNTNLKY